MLALVEMVVNFVSLTNGAKGVKVPFREGGDE